MLNIERDKRWVCVKTEADHSDRDRNSLQEKGQYPVTSGSIVSRTCVMMGTIKLIWLILKQLEALVVDSRNAVFRE